MIRLLDFCVDTGEGKNAFFICERNEEIVFTIVHSQQQANALIEQCRAYSSPALVNSAEQALLSGDPPLRIQVTEAPLEITGMDGAFLCLIFQKKHSKEALRVFLSSNSDERADILCSPDDWPEVIALVYGVHEKGRSVHVVHSKQQARQALLEYRCDKPRQDHNQLIVDTSRLPEEHDAPTIPIRDDAGTSMQVAAEYYVAIKNAVEAPPKLE